MTFKKRVFGLVFVFFLFFGASLVMGDKLVKNDWVEYDASFVLGGDIYSVLLNPSWDRLVFRKDNVVLGVANFESCFEAQGMRFCFENYSYDKKFSFDPFYPGVHIKIYELSVDTVKEEEFGVDVSFSESGLEFVNEKRDVVVSLSNVGDKSLSGANIVLRFPRNVSVTNRGSFLQTSSRLSNYFSLQKGRSVDLSFSYEVSSVGSYDVVYEVFVGNELIDDGKFSVSGKLPYSVSVKNPSKMDVRDINTFELLIKNEHPREELVISELNIRGSSNFQYLLHRHLSSTSAGRFFDAGRVLLPSSERSYSIRYRPLFSGDYSFRVGGVLSQNAEYVFEVVDEFEVLSNELDAGLFFSREKISLGASNNLRLVVENNHPSLSFSNLNVVLESSLFNGSRAVSRLGAGESLTLFDERLMPPQVRSNEEFFANASITYLDGSGVSRSLDVGASFELVGNDTLFDVSQSVSKRDVAPGDEVIVEVSLRGLVGNPFEEVNVEDELSQQVIFVSGDKSAVSRIDSSDVRKVYVYKFEVPEVLSSKELVISTLVSVPSIGYEQVETSTISIDIDEALLVDEDQIDDVVDDVEEEDAPSFVEEEEERDGFLKRLVDGVANFFAGLFGGG